MFSQFLCAVTVLISISVSSQTVAADPVRRYTDVASPIRYDALHLSRRSVAGANGVPVYQNAWDIGHSIEVVYSGNGRFGRHTASESLPPGAKYEEYFLWDERKEWAYLDYASLLGDIDPTVSESRCSAIDPGSCSFVVAEGQRWLTGDIPDSRSKANSPSQLIWDSSTTGIGRGHVFYDRSGNPRARIGYILAGQVWRRLKFGNRLVRSYADSLNTAERLGWADPGTSRLPGITIDPGNAYILRQYSDCAIPSGASYSLLGTEPWRVCKIFEDHVYARSRATARQPSSAMGEVLVVVGFTPAYQNWQNTVGDAWAVTHVMIMKRRVK